MMFVFALILILISYLTPITNACFGYKLHVNYFRNCGEDDIVLISNDFGPTLNNDCSVTMDGCIMVTRPFNSAKVTYDILRNGIHYSGTKDACNILENAQADFIPLMDTIGIPRYCPIQEGTVCGDGRQVNIRKHRIKLPLMAGNTAIRMELLTDAGKACVEFSAILTRRPFG